MHLYIIQVILIGIFETLNKSTGLNMEEALTSLIIFCNIGMTTVMYQMETDAFSKVLTIFSRKTLAWSFSNSYNHIREDLML